MSSCNSFAVPYSYCKIHICFQLLQHGGVSPVHLTDSVSKAYAVGASVVYIQPTNIQLLIVQLIEKADETLFNNIIHNPLHILYLLLPKQIGYCYSLRSRSHNLELTQTTMTIEILLTECSFAIAIPVALPNTYNTNLH